ncbi:MAG: hypothetical protein R3E39_02970 [Anaerolineae bacterium]
MTETLHPHEDHDAQRSKPLIERLESESVVINPPIVSPMGASQFLILDGANRFQAFRHLKYQHIIVQVASYDSGYVQLKTWRHLVCDWNKDAFLNQLFDLKDIQLYQGQHANAIAHIMFRDGQIYGLMTPIENTHERNASLRHVVNIYQQNATLQRTALTEPTDIWLMHPNAIAIVEFPQYQPADIIAAARFQAYLPPGITRHIINGRALRVNYPLSALRDTTYNLKEKNLALNTWIQDKLAKRQIRYYAEASYQFDE